MARLGALLGAAVNGNAGALAVTGEPGIGKSALVETFLLDVDPTSVRIVRLPGHSAEADLPYAGIDRLVMDLPERGGLDPHLDHALAVATGRSQGQPPERSLVGLALLTLLSQAREPVLVVVNDSHLLDRSSLAALAFVARRLKAETVALVFTLRPDDIALEALGGIELIQLGGLEADSAVELLNALIDPPLDPQLSRAVAASLTGHPLALTELARRPDAGELAVRAVSSRHIPPGELLARAYHDAVAQLTPPAREFALLAATDTTGAAPVLRRAAELQGIEADAEDQLGATGLVEIAVVIRFRHQLIGAALYDAATPAQRRMAHRVLAKASEELGYSTAATLHVAAASRAPDPEVAKRLEGLAASAGGRGAWVTCAGHLLRAADFTPVGPTRTGRLLDAVEAALTGGAAVLANSVLSQIDADSLTGIERGRFLGAWAQQAVFLGDPVGTVRAAATFADAADCFHGRSAELEQGALLQAFQFLLTTERATQDLSPAELGERLGRAATSSSEPVARVLRALADHIALPVSKAVVALRLAVSDVQAGDEVLLGSAGLIGAPLALALGEPNIAVALLERVSDLARVRGSLQQLDAAQWVLGSVHTQRGDVVAAQRAVENGRDLRRAIGYPSEQVVNVGLLALSGEPFDVIDAAADAVRATGFEGAWTSAQLGIGARLLADSRYNDAFVTLEPLVTANFLHVGRLALPDFVEAAARSGMTDQAERAARTLVDLARATGSLWHSGLAARSRALVSNSQVEEHLASAITDFDQIHAEGDEARARLLLGEWLRRQRRRRESREQLAAAVTLFDRLGSPRFAERARREFAATGEHLPPPVSPWDLTPQEAMVADLAAAGRSNQEIAASLFISANTVDYHLRKVFRKRGITSRRQLQDERPA